MIRHRFACWFNSAYVSSGPRTPPPIASGVFAACSLKQLVHALVRRKLDPGFVPLVENTMTLRRVEHGQTIDGLGIVGHHGFEQLTEVSEVALHGRRIEQRGGVLDYCQRSCRPLSCSESVRSNFATRCGDAAEAALRARQLQRSLPSRSARRTSPGTAGCASRLRTGLSQSTTCSKGMSWCCCAASACSLACCSSSLTVGDPTGPDAAPAC